ncbi:MAG: hypothetical protein ACJA1C_002840 [Crocinitomicaceae bacterium]|jgi:hypothetical protein
MPIKKRRIKVLFCDGHRHRAFKHSKHDRIITIIDVVHAVFAHKKKKIVANALFIIWFQRILLSIKF